MSKVSNTFETRSTYIVTDCLVSKLPKDFEELLKRIGHELWPDNCYFSDIFLFMVL